MQQCIDLKVGVGAHISTIYTCVYDSLMKYWCIAIVIIRLYS